ncbi:MAG: hypothetical protein ACI9FB_002666, partial [Candidatus Azotimanducaceae bacterium]
PKAMDICSHTTPLVYQISDEHSVACHLFN